MSEILIYLAVFASGAATVVVLSALAMSGRRPTPKREEPPEGLRILRDDEEQFHVHVYDPATPSHEKGPESITRDDIERQAERTRLWTLARQAAEEAAKAGAPKEGGGGE